MVTIPDSERVRFGSVISGQAQRFGLSPEEYLRKIWYHEEAAKIGEYMAMALLDQLLSISPLHGSTEKAGLDKNSVVASR